MNFSLLNCSEALLTLGNEDVLHGDCSTNAASVNTLILKVKSVLCLLNVESKRREQWLLNGNAESMDVTSHISHQLQKRRSTDQYCGMTVYR